MARPVTTLVVFFLAFNLFAGVIGAAGIDAMMGLDSQVGGDDDVDSSVNQADEVTTGTGGGSTLFGMYNVLANGLTSVVDVVFPGLDMLERAGAPNALTEQILLPLFTIIIFIDFISFLRGWGL